MLRVLFVHIFFHFYIAERKKEEKRIEISFVAMDWLIRKSVIYHIQVINHPKCNSISNSAMKYKSIKRDSNDKT